MWINKLLPLLIQIFNVIIWQKHIHMQRTKQAMHAAHSISLVCIGLSIEELSVQQNQFQVHSIHRFQLKCNLFKSFFLENFAFRSYLIFRGEFSFIFKEFRWWECVCVCEVHWQSKDQRSRRSGCIYFESDVNGKECTADIKRAQLRPISIVLVVWSEVVEY